MVAERAEVGGRVAEAMTAGHCKWPSNDSAVTGIAAEATMESGRLTPKLVRTNVDWPGIDLCTCR